MRERSPPAFGEALRVWLKIGLLGFGGPAGQIALLHRETVETRAWIDEDAFARALSFCMLLPGPEAQQLATWIGWRLHGIRGGVAAGLLFVLPGLGVMLGLSALYVVHGRSSWVGPVLLGLKAAVVALVLQALLRMGKRALKDRMAVLVCAAAFVLLAFSGVPFPLVVLGAGLLGWLTARGGEGEAPASDGAPVAGRRRTALVCLALWLAPIALAWVLAPGSPLAWMGLTFGGLAAVSFGGAYAALAYLGQAASVFGWLTASQMLDGLGLAETTPGPLILVFVFVGFVGAYQTAAPEWAWTLGLLGGLMAAWTTFAPSFLWIFGGGPLFERWGRRPRPARALALISAASVGVIGQLAFWFAVHLLFRSGRTVTLGPLRALAPDFSSLDPAAAGLTILALMLTFATRLPMLGLVAALVAAGVALKAVGLA
ncbi:MULTISPECIES: chromate efflux transporter [Caulobacter]|uniref:Chromate transporter, chromate ion transporter family n=1 Tax=Caulobacter vibrioides OR37 TaxID=1292034 RepID=R0ELE3_CAUVI|nr:MULTISPECIES: chromate efflux transporter [Caulobacter]ENZ81942.1 chromate transporter, chromate ion transporter family [Caulobacter vibrioides OR37]MBQ1562481.1 chromate efflux transporter [Caulobacter sp.]